MAIQQILAASMFFSGCSLAEDVSRTDFNPIGDAAMFTAEDADTMAKSQHRSNIMTHALTGEITQDEIAELETPIVSDIMTRAQGREMACWSNNAQWDDRDKAEHSRWKTIGLWCGMELEKRR